MVSISQASSYQYQKAQPSFAANREEMSLQEKIEKSNQEIQIYRDRVNAGLTNVENDAKERASTIDINKISKASIVDRTQIAATEIQNFLQKEFRATEEELTRPIRDNNPRTPVDVVRMLVNSTGLRKTESQSYPVAVYDMPKVALNHVEALEKFLKDKPANTYQELINNLVELDKEKRVETIEDLTGKRLEPSSIKSIMD